MRIHSPVARLLLLVAAILFLLSSPVVVAAVSTQGYATYKLSISGPGFSRSLVVRESVAPSTRPNLLQLEISAAGSQQNFTFSELVNASSPELFPYVLFGGNNQSIAYRQGNFSIDLSITRSISSTVIFNGSKYDLTGYSFTALVSGFNRTGGALSGNFSLMPSSLIYSADVEINGTTLSANLLATSLSLDPPSQGNTGQIETVAISGAGVAVAALLAFLIVRKVRRTGSHPYLPGSNPPHWVD